MDENYQLFRVLPPRDFIEQFITIFGINNWDEYFFFTIADVDARRVADQIRDNWLERFREFYFPNKFVKFFTDINTKKAIIILRQLLRTVQYKLRSQDKFKGRQKYILYNIQPVHQTDTSGIRIENKRIHISLGFDETGTSSV
jgi:hypothetical protein